MNSYICHENQPGQPERALTKSRFAVQSGGMEGLILLSRTNLRPGAIAPVGGFIFAESPCGSFFYLALEKH